VRHGTATPYAPAHLEAVQTQPVAWDADARDTAWQEAQRLAGRDPEAAALLVAHLRVAAEPESAPDDLTATPLPASEPFDPMAMFAELAAYYHWSDESMRRMPWKRLLAYYREAVRMHERDIAQARGAKAGDAPTQDEFVRALRRTAIYDGEVVPIS